MQDLSKAFQKMKNSMDEAMKKRLKPPESLKEYSLYLANFDSHKQHAGLEIEIPGQLVDKFIFNNLLVRIQLILITYVK